MKIDEYGCVVMEKDGTPGDLGDSCAESSRLDIIAPVHRHKLDLNAFVTANGFVRHPKSPWREDDFSNDQALPLILADYIRGAWWKIPGTNTIASPGVWAAVRGNWKLLALTVKMQNLLFALPYRWSDSKKWFERTSGSSADYLNYFVSIVFLRRRGITVKMRPETLDKVRSYYANEPRSDWIVEAYLGAAANEIRP